jgi:hypothetical protein
MDRMKEYRELVKRLLGEYAELSEQQSEPGVETVLILDDEHGNYLWMRLGWAKERRVFDITLYVRVCEGKIWIEQDWTEEGIATDLLNAGVPNQDIVLAFHPPDMRAYTEFAVA